MGVTWKSEEVNFLASKIGIYSLNRIAKELGRTVDAIEVRITKMEIGDTKAHTGMLTINELSKAIDIEHKTIKLWTQKEGLKCIRKVTRRTQKFNLIEIKNFWKWAESNKEKINFSKIEKHSLLPEPKWVDEERKKDFYNVPKRKNKKWTVLEDEKLIKLYNAGKKAKDIAIEMDRSLNGIERRIRRLRENKKINKNRKILLKWTEEEWEMMIELEKQGLKDTEIAFELGREVEHIQAKRANMRRKGLYIGNKRGKKYDN